MARLYRREYHLVAVPKTSVHENRRPILPHYDVRFPWNPLHAKPVAVAVLPQPLSYAPLGRSILTAYPRHAVVPLLGSHRVGHDALKYFDGVNEIEGIARGETVDVLPFGDVFGEAFGVANAAPGLKADERTALLVRCPDAVSIGLRAIDIQDGIAMLVPQFDLCPLSLFDN